MGYFWNLLQQSQISEQCTKASSLEARVAYLESELQKTQEVLIKTLKVLEEQIGKDLSGDRKIG